MIATEEQILTELLIILYKMVLALESERNWKGDHSKESCRTEHG